MATTAVDREIWSIVNAVLLGILIKPLFIIWLVLLCLGRRKNDPARVAFTYLKIIFPLFILALFLLTAGAAIKSVLFYWDDNSYSDSFDIDAFNQLDAAQLHIRVVGIFFFCASDILYILALAELGNGFLFCLDGKRTPFQRFVRYGALIWCFILMVLIIAWLGKMEAIWTPYLNAIIEDNVTYSQLRSIEATLDQGLIIGDKLEGAVDILIWLGNLALIPYASIAVHKCRGNKQLHNSAVLFLVITILQLLRWTWTVALDAKWLIPQDAPAQPDWIGAADPILNVWTLFVTLVLFFVIAIRKQKGLWTTAQPWSGAAPVYAQPAPATYDYQQNAYNQQGAYNQQNAYNHQSVYSVQQEAPAPFANGQPPQTQFYEAK